MDANQVWGVDEAIVRTKALAQFSTALDGGADEPGRHPRPRPHRARDRSDRGGDGRARAQPRHVQAAAPGRRDPLLPDRQRAARWRQRGARGAVHGGKARGHRLPARGRRRPLRVRPASLAVRRDRGRTRRRRSDRRVRRSPARALRRSRPGRRCGLRRAGGARLQRRDASRVAGAVPVSLPRRASRLG